MHVMPVCCWGAWQASGLLHIFLLFVIISLPWYNLSQYDKDISGLL